MSSSYIYTSEKAMPYVYWLQHKSSGEYYIGSRTNSHQPLPSHLDLPRYRTSSKIVKPRFDEFDWFIFAEFLDRKSAYDFEQDLIKQHINDPFNLNKNHHGQCCWVGKKHSPETLAKMRANSTKGRKMTEEQKQLQRLKPRKPVLFLHPRNLKTVICPHCNVSGKGGNMTRYHFNNCKFKQLQLP